MARVPGVDPDSVDPSIRNVFDAQIERWGAPLSNHLLYARRPSVIRGVRAMWDGLGESGLIDGQLQALINRRVAALNGCLFWQDLNAAVGSELGLSDEKILALPDYASSPLFDERERALLEYADCMTITGRDVSDELFARVRQFCSEDALVELTALIAWENASSKFNRALRVPPGGFWRCDSDPSGAG